MRINKYMTYTSSEKAEIIKIVEESKVSISQTLRELKVSRSSFYDWYHKYNEYGIEGLKKKTKTPQKFWNAIPEWEKDRVVKATRKYPEKSCREIAFHITDEMGYFISESSVYRILREREIITTPVFHVISAKDKFQNPTTAPNQLWQSDFTYLKVLNWGWYYLCTVMDDYSRYILSWKLCRTMSTDDVKQTLDIARKNSGFNNVKVKHRLRLLSDNGPCYISKELSNYLAKHEIKHTRGKPFHPQTQGKIERYHRSMKNLLLLDNYYTPLELEKQIERWVEYYNHHRYHEAINNIKPVDKYFSRESVIQKKRRLLKIKTIKNRKQINLNYYAKTS